jgi:Fe-S-cluster containining protein
MPKSFYEKGIRFQCQGSGKCCVSHGQFGFVYVTLQDRKRFAEHLGMSTREFTKKYCEKTDGFFHLKDSKDLNGDCLFLKNQRCSVYEARPTQCRTWPFWPEVMNAKTWKMEVQSFCPGVGKGPVWKAAEIEALLRVQSEADHST